MINNNESDRIEMAKEIAEVRKTGLTNMFDYRAVVDILRDLEYDYTAEYLRNNKEDYMPLLRLSGKY